MFKRITELGDDHREVRRPTPLRRDRGRGTGAAPDEVEELHRALRRAGTLVRHRLVRRRGRHLPREPHPAVAALGGLGAARRPTRGTSTGGWPTPRAGGSEARPPCSVTPTSRSPRAGGRTTSPTRRGPVAMTRLRTRGPVPRSEPSSGRDVAGVGAAAGVAALAVLAVVAVLLALWANHQRAQANSSERIAVARQLAASSDDLGAARPFGADPRRRPSGPHHGAETGYRLAGRRGGARAGPCGVRWG